MVIGAQSPPEGTAESSARPVCGAARPLHGPGLRRGPRGCGLQARARTRHTVNFEGVRHQLLKMGATTLSLWAAGAMGARTSEI